MKIKYSKYFLNKKYYLNSIQIYIPMSMKNTKIQTYNTNILNTTFFIHILYNVVYYISE